MDQLLRGERALGQLHGEARALQRGAHLVEVLQVLFEGALGVYQDVIQVDEAFLPCHAAQDRPDTLAHTRHDPRAR